MIKAPCTFLNFVDDFNTVIPVNRLKSAGKFNGEILSILILVFSVYAICELQAGFAQTNNWKRYNDPGNKFNFLYPVNWNATTRHLDDSGYTEVTLLNPNSLRMKISIVYTPNDSFLRSSSGSPTVPPTALRNLEEEMSEQYLFFNSTGKFPHKYSVQGLASASDLVDFEKIEGKPGKMLIVYSKTTNKDSLVFIYSESKRSFYKSLSNASQIIKSISVTGSDPFKDLF